MEKRTARENLKSFSWIYIILSIIVIIGTLICNFVPSIVNSFKATLTKEEMFGLNVTAVVNVLVYLWYFWLARRASDGKSKGTLYMILLILGIVGAIVSAISTRSIAALACADFIADVMALGYLLKIRKEN